jgi:hypothetical protein
MLLPLQAVSSDQPGFIMFNRIAASVFAFASIIAFGGCSNTPKVENEAATEGIQAVVDQLNVAQGEIDKVLASIDALQAPGDMKTAYANYVAAVGSVRKAGERVRDRREAMQAKRDEYIARWQKELESISNPDVKAALVERKELVSAEVATVRDDYLPFLKNLEEIQKALALDLNPSGIAAMKKPLDQARADGLKLKASISRLQGELNRIIGSMAPATAPVTPATAPAKPAVPTAPAPK